MDDCGVGRKGNLREMVLEGKFLPVLLNLKRKIGILSQESVDSTLFNDRKVRTRWWH